MVIEDVLVLVDEFEVVDILEVVFEVYCVCCYDCV